MSKRLKLLDLYCGAGGAAMGYRRAGFEVTGVDLRHQSRYAGDAFIKADALRYLSEHGHEYDAIHASPPCQKFTALTSMHNARDHDDLITPTRERLIETGKPYVIENVVGAPIDGIMLCGSMFGLGVMVSDGWRQLRRHRIFESNVPLDQPKCVHSGATIVIYGDHAMDRSRKPGVRERGVDFTDFDNLTLASFAMGIDWMTWKELSQAIPPAYSHYVGIMVTRAISKRTEDER